MGVTSVQGKWNTVGRGKWWLNSVWWELLACSYSALGTDEPQPAPTLLMWNTLLLNNELWLPLKIAKDSDSTAGFKKLPCYCNAPSHSRPHSADSHRTDTPCRVCPLTFEELFFFFLIMHQILSFLSHILLSPVRWANLLLLRSSAKPLNGSMHSDPLLEVLGQESGPDLARPTTGWM